MIRSEPARTAARRTAVPVGITVYGCERDEAALFGEIAAGLGVVPTITEAAVALQRLGARKIYAFATHALLSGPAVERLRASCIDEVVVANTIRIPEDRCIEKLKVLSIAGLMAKAIGYEHSNQSVSSLFDDLPLTTYKD